MVMEIFNGINYNDNWKSQNWNVTCRYTYENSEVMIILSKKQLAASNNSDTKKLYMIL